MDKQLKNKFKVYILISGFVLLVCLLTFVIYLGIKQHETDAELSTADDRMRANINMLLGQEK